MSVKVNAGEIKRGDYIFVDPSRVIVKDDRRGRRDQPTQEQIIQRALSMLDKGQIQPVEVRRDSEKRLILTLGFTRTAAARLIREGFEVTGEDGETTFHGDEKFMLKASVYDCSEEEAFERNIAENVERNATTPIDDAINQRLLQDRYGKSDAEVAKMYGYKGTSKVGKLRKLLLLDRKIQDKVHCGDMGVDAALAMLDLPEEKQAGAIAQATSENGKVNGQVVKQVVRQHHMNDDDKSESEVDESNDGESAAPAEKPKRSQSRSLRELRVFFEGLDSEDSEPALRRFSKDVLGFISGDKSEKAMTKAVDRLLDASREAVTA